MQRPMAQSGSEAAGLQTPLAGVEWREWVWMRVVIVQECLMIERPGQGQQQHEQAPVGYERLG